MRNRPTLSTTLGAERWAERWDGRYLRARKRSRVDDDFKEENHLNQLYALGLHEGALVHVFFWNPMRHENPEEPEFLDFTGIYLGRDPSAWLRDNSDYVPSYDDYFKFLSPDDDGDFKYIHLLWFSLEHTKILSPRSDKYTVREKQNVT